MRSCPSPTRPAQIDRQTTHSGGSIKLDARYTQRTMQGVIKSYDPGSGDGVVVAERDFSEYDLAPDALEGSIFRMLRQGQRVLFDVDTDGRATGLHLGSEQDLGTPSVKPLD
jgi:cold shock CspA family protein